MKKLETPKQDSQTEPHNSRLCLCGCGKPVGDGRSHKRFVNDGHRNVYNNKIKKKNQDEIKLIDTVLKKNRKILKDALKDKEYEIISATMLQNLGFNFKYFTHFFISGHNNTFTVCYNYAYRKLESGKYKIIKESETGSLA